MKDLESETEMPNTWKTNLLWGCLYQIHPLSTRTEDLHAWKWFSREISYGLFMCLHMYISHKCVSFYILILYHAVRKHIVDNKHRYITQHSEFQNYWSTMVYVQMKYIAVLQYAKFLKEYLNMIPTWWRSIINVDCSAVINLLPMAQNILFVQCYYHSVTY